MSFKPEVEINGREWGQNNLAFATRQEALHYAEDLFQRWTLTTAFRAVESEQPVNYSIVDGKLIPVDTITEGEPS